MSNVALASPRSERDASALAGGSALHGRPPRVVIVGGGFAGMAVARALKGARARVAMVDRENHHVFQPLPYQVATASLSPSSISQPIRATLSDCRNCIVVLANITHVDLENRRAHGEEGSNEYDYGFRNRVRVLFNWGCKWLLNTHDARLIVGDSRMRLRAPHGPNFTPRVGADPAGRGNAPLDG